MRWKPEFGSKSPCCLCCDLNGLVYKVMVILVIFASFSVLFIFDAPSLKLHESGASVPVRHLFGRVMSMPISILCSDFVVYISYFFLVIFSD